MSGVFEYNICNQADAELFHKQCSALETCLPGLKEDGLLQDVDGSLIQRYTHPRGIVLVRNDMQVDALYVSSDFDLLPYFNQD